MPWCPKCGTEYHAGVTKCKKCRILLVEKAPGKQDALVLSAGIQRPIVVHIAQNRLETEMLCDLLRKHDIVVLDRPAAFRQIQAYSGPDARFGIELVVDASQKAQAEELIDRINEELSQSPVDEEELMRLAEEQAAETPEQPMEDNLSFRMLSAVLGVIAIALVLLYFVSQGI